MKWMPVIVSFAAVVAATAIPSQSVNPGRIFCDAAPEPSFLIKVLELVAKEEQEEFRLDPSNLIIVDTYFHVISYPEAEVSVSNDTLVDQLAVLNNIFEPYGFRFRLVETDFTVNRTWAKEDERDTMKRSLRKGGYNDYNVYFLPDAYGMGNCVLPRDINATDFNTFFDDGAIINTNTVPGVAEVGISGKTLAHETGHWLGLLHVFEGYNCTGTGDLISDTPIQKVPTEFSCPTFQDSCPDQPGQDSYHNYMDYSNDDCMDHFTPGQLVRMHVVWSNFRQVQTDLENPS